MTEQPTNSVHDLRSGGEEKNGEHVQKTANSEHVATDMHSLDAGVKVDAVDREMIERGDRIGAKLVRSLLAHYDASPDLSLRAENERLKHDNSELLAAADADAYVARQLLVRATKAEEKLEEAAKVLEKIERWHGEFPETGQFWKNADGTDSDRTISYGAAYGSNGERDYMRSQARSFLANLKGAE